MLQFLRMQTHAHIFLLSRSTSTLFLCLLPYVYNAFYFHREEEILPRANERYDETKVRKLSRGSKKLAYASFSWAAFKFYEC
jgi:hypothetical protein